MKANPHSIGGPPVPRLTAAQLREPLLDGAIKAARSLGHRDVTRKSLFDDPAHRALFRRMLEEMIDSPESDESAEAAAALLKEVGPGSDD
jgi:hypothetical protein